MHTKKGEAKANRFVAKHRAPANRKIKSNNMFSSSPHTKNVNSNRAILGRPLQISEYFLIIFSVCIIFAEYSEEKR